ncbi:PREDICTED: transmembrane protease serine 13-like [Condylura cristata]|uniref:transmembrane protease serine 13-like n=1 Tax=Condylura cristata TaxID=143302 RepID=UPI00064327D7|nr:PREDICTED: transmembrane protease serine 13-like [Condylura cristata]
MALLELLSCFIVVSTSLGSGTPDNYPELNITLSIRNGTKAGPGSSPWLVAVMDANRILFCWGSLITENWVITAAHCNVTTSDLVGTGLYEPHSGRKDIQILKIAQVFIYPQLYWSPVDSDIALLKLASPARFSKTVSPALLPTASDSFRSGRLCVTMGWALTHPNDTSQSRELQQAVVPLLANSECRKHWGKIITDAKICAGDNGVSCWETATSIQFCWGSLINENWVITAAHCNITTSDVVVAGLYERPTGRKDIQILKIAQVFIYPQLYWSPVDSDIALLKLASPARFSKTVSPALLPTASDSFRSGRLCVTMGWALTHPNDTSQSRELQQAVVLLLANSECRKHWGRLITDAKICAGDNGVSCWEVRVGFGTPVNGSELSIQPRIINGTDARPGSSPWLMAVMTPTRIQYCWGSLINKSWVITAAHCNVTTADLVVTGLYESRSGREDIQILNIAKVFIYPQLKLNPVDSDIALLKLASPARFSKTVSPALLPTASDSFRSGRLCGTMGWALTYPNDTSQSMELQRTMVPLLINSECRKHWGKSITDAKICAGDNGVSCWEVNSGAPLVCRKKKVRTLVGVMSFISEACPTQKPLVFTRVSKISPWIQETMASN